MALFSRKKEDASASTATGTAPSSTKVAAATDRNLAAVLVKPHITEKAVGKSEQNVYTFVVHADATKFDVRDAVQSVFSVTPMKVRIVNRKPRRVMSRTKGRTITEPGMKKAYVYLKAGDSIEIT